MQAFDFAREKIEPAHSEEELTQSVASQEVRIHSCSLTHLEVQLHMVHRIPNKAHQHTEVRLI